MDERGQYGITILHPCETNPEDQKPRDIVFDLVAIHGLNGDSIGTWTHKSGHPMWLKHLLPDILPNVRIMTYGYNASFRNFTAVQDLRSMSSKLLSELVDVRDTDEKSRRPIVFICHSLGGIIAKKALLLRVSGQLAQVQQAVFGIIFLATPHNGSSVAAYGSVIANIASNVSPLRPAQGLLEALRKDSQSLFEITDDFVHKASGLHIVSFYEMQMTRVGIRKKMIVEESSAVLFLPNETRIGQNSDHREIARFLSLHDRNFRPVKRTLETFRDEIGQRIGESIDCGSNSATPVAQACQNIFEIPFNPCDTFQGRKAYLDRMAFYFEPQLSSSTSDQRSYAVCGLGGSGKTQIALKYAHLYRHNYPTGVFFITALSEAALHADIARICENLQLNNVTNKPQAFKQWLSRSEHNRWLLIFDSADDLESVRLSKYIPQTSWGHLIVTTRDQGAIGNIGKEGLILGKLESDDAKSVLLWKSGIPKPSAEDSINAQKIVEFLGCLPLAVDQAGAYIRSRNKSLAIFLRLCHERQEDILSFKPRLTDYDRTVFTTWEMNFEQVEKDSKDASALLLLFCYLDAAHISEAMLDRACSSLRRWNRAGEVCEEAPSLSGVDDSIVGLIKDEIRFDNAIEKLLSFSLIQLGNDVEGLRIFSIHPLVQYCASQRIPRQTQDHWRAQAIAMVSHAFPRSEYLDPFYRDLGIAQLPHVLRVSKEFQNITSAGSHLSLIKSGISSMLVAASRFSTPSWKHEAISQAKILSQDVRDPYLHICVARRESSILRIMGQRTSSDDVLKKFIGSTILFGHDEPLAADARWNAQRGELIHSFAENLLQDGELDAAKHELLQWNPTDLISPSTMERIVARSKNISLGRILKVQGCFQDALDLLLITLMESDADNIETMGWRRVLLSNIGDVYCELGKPSEAQDLLTPELERMELAQTKNISSGRRLQMTLAESLLKAGMYQQARGVLQYLQSVLKRISDPDVIARRANFRVWASLARVAHLESRWDDCLECWKEAREALAILDRRAGSQPGIVHYGISYALFRKGHVQDSLEEMREGQRLLSCEEQRRYWIVGLQSYWRDYIIECVHQNLSSSAALG